MDVWVFTAARGVNFAGADFKPQVIEVFSFEPSAEDKKQALRRYLDGKLGWGDYEEGEAALRNEDLERMLYHWSEKEFRVYCKTLRGPEEYQTSDGYKFKRERGGTYTDGDQTYAGIEHLLALDLIDP